MQWDVYVQSVNRIMLFQSCMDILLQKLWKRRKKVISNLVVVKYFAYPRASRRVFDKEIVHIEKDRVADFYQNVIWLYCPWTEIIECKVCDGYSYELTITYKDNRKKKMHGDLGGGTVDKTVTNFLCTIPKMKARIEGCGIENEDC